jgi:hypothetical protein
MKAKTDQHVLPFVRFLTKRIGSRGTGTQGEKDAGAYVSACLKKWGIPGEILTCRSIISMNHYPLSVNALGILAIILYPIHGGWVRWLAAGLALLVAPFMALTIRTSVNPLRIFLPKVTSASVLGKIEPTGRMTHQVVLLSHLDTNKCRLTWKPEGLKNLEPLTYVTLLVQASLGILYLFGAVTGERWGIWSVSLLPGIYLLAMIITLILDDRTPYSTGANDNASSVGVVLSIAKALSIHPLAHTRVWLAFSGAEETDHFGLRSILNAHAQDMRQAFFIDQEGVGAGELVMVTRHGIGLHYTPDAGLLKLARMVADEHPEWCMEGKKMAMSEEVSTLTHLGYRAVCIAGYDRSTGGLPQWHQLEDTLENLDPDCLIKARDFVTAILKKIDAELSIARRK